MNLFQKYNHLGFNNPYYYEKNGTFIVKRSFSALKEEYNGPCIIDPVAVIEFLNKQYFFADRTIIQGLQKTPWLARPNKLLNKWEYANAPKHDFLDIEEEVIAKAFFQKICSEIRLAIGNNKKIGILLSGGMDSRMVAGALDFLIKTSKLKNIEVTGLTWGNDCTRDVVYAEEIAARLNWKWKHYLVTPQDLLNNIKETAVHGCEYSPIHLHGIPQIRNDNNLDLILAGSYGDSVGRSEYSGRKVQFLNPLLRRISNVGRIINQSVFNQYVKYIENDIYKYHELFPEKESYMQNELDYELHYMRRLLNPCMELLTEKMDFYQVFTHPDTFGYIWSIKPGRRNDLVYKYMLNEFITKLDDIPWSRTGLPYDQKKGTPDSYMKQNHSYQTIIVKEIFNEIEILVLSDEIKQLKIFNQKSLKTLINLIKLFPPDDVDYLGILIWLASLAEMTRIYGIRGVDYGKSNGHKSESNPISISYEYLINQSRYKIATLLKKI